MKYNLGDYIVFYEDGLLYIKKVLAKDFSYNCYLVRVTEREGKVKVKGNIGWEWSKGQVEASSNKKNVYSLEIKPDGLYWWVYKCNVLEDSSNFLNEKEKKDKGDKRF